MEFKFNSYNENYIMINRNNILMECYQLNAKTNKTKEEIEILKSLNELHNNLCTFKDKNIYTVIIDIAIEKESDLGHYVLTTNKNPQYITFGEIIHALMICINRNDWQYYNQLTSIVKTYGQIIQNHNKGKNFKISYEEIKLINGEEIANYIINSKHYYTNKVPADKEVYLYQNSQITNTKLPEPTKTKHKRKTKSK